MVAERKRRYDQSSAPTDCTYIVLHPVDIELANSTSPILTLKLLCRQLAFMLHLITVLPYLARTCSLRKCTIHKVRVLSSYIRHMHEEAGRTRVAYQRRTSIQRKRFRPLPHGVLFSVCHVQIKYLAENQMPDTGTHRRPRLTPYGGQRQGCMLAPGYSK